MNLTNHFNCIFIVLDMPTGGSNITVGHIQETEMLTLQAETAKAHTTVEV